MTSASGWLGQTSPSPQPLPADPSIVLTAGVQPFSAEELESAWTDWSGYSPTLADVMLVIARTGLRWDEARAARVADTCADDLAVPGRRARKVPVAPRIRLVLDRLSAEREPEELLFTTGLGEPLQRPAVLRRLRWAQTGRGRRLVDLRHTAAHLWLAEGACPCAVRRWMGGR